MLLRRLDAAGLRVRSARLARPTLDVFLILTGRTLRESAGSTPDDDAAVAHYGA